MKGTLKGCTMTNELRDRLLIVAKGRLGNRPGAYLQFQHCLQHTVQGAVFLARADLALPAATMIAEGLGNSRAAESVNSRLAALVDEWAKAQPLPPAVEPLPNADSDVPATQGNIMKKAALVAALKHEWTSIERDIGDATRNGLKDAAHTGKHGEWDTDKARAWAISKRKIKQAVPVHSLAAAWPGTAQRHTINR